MRDNRFYAFFGKYLKFFMFGRLFGCGMDTTVLHVLFQKSERCFLLKTN